MRDHSMYKNGLYELIEIWNTDFFGDDALFELKNSILKKTDHAPWGTAPEDLG